MVAVAHGGSARMIENPDETPAPDEPPKPGAWRRDDLTHAVGPSRPQPPQGGLDGCLTVLGKIILTLFIGIFVLGGLVFATCFLGMRR